MGEGKIEVIMISCLAGLLGGGSVALGAWAGRLSADGYNMVGLLILALLIGGTGQYLATIAERAKERSKQKTRPE